MFYVFKKGFFKEEIESSDRLSVITKYQERNLSLVSVVLRDGESQRNLSKRFRKAVIRSGVLKECRKRRWFVSKNERRRLEREKAIRRMKQRRHRRY